MKKLLQVAAILIMGCSTASAHLIHSLHITAKGSRGWKDVGTYSGLLIERKWCLGKGTLDCPHLCGGGMLAVHPTTEAGVGSRDLAAYELEFISSSMSNADLSTETSGLITQVFEVNGKIVVLTAKYTKVENSFIFDVASNGTYEENLKELNSIPVEQ